jgi:alpha-tubulin suppressor-like RCC1 family protein
VTKNTPQKIELSNIVAISAGGTHNLLLSNEKIVFSFGNANVFYLV